MSMKNPHIGEFRLTVAEANGHADLYPVVLIPFGTNILQEISKNKSRRNVKTTNRSSLFLYLPTRCIF